MTVKQMIKELKGMNRKAEVLVLDCPMVVGSHHAFQPATYVESIRGDGTPRTCKKVLIMYGGSGQPMSYIDDVWTEATED